MMSLTGSHVTVNVPMPDDDVEHRVENREWCKEHQICVRKACRRRSEEDSNYCSKHLAAQRAYQAKWIKAKRDEWDANQQCMRCGAEARRRGLRICVACAIATGKTPPANVDSHVENRGDRVAKRLIPWTNSPHNEGRVRLRGGKRGAPSASERDRRDLQDIRRVLDRYTMALDEVYSVETQALSKTQRDAAVRAAHAGLALAVRLGMEALVTYGYECPVLAADFDPGDDGIDHDLRKQAREIVKSGR